jgi:site-specific recombinase XerD
LAIVRAFLTWLVGEGLLRANPTTNIRGPKEKRVERRALAHEDVEKLIAAQPLREQVGISAWPGSDSARTPCAGFGSETSLIYPKNHRMRPMDHASLHRWFKRCLERAGLPHDIKLHELRYTAAQALYDATGDIVLSQELLRHGDIRTTRGHVQPSMERLRAAQAALEASWK